MFARKDTVQIVGFNSDYYAAFTLFVLRFVKELTVNADAYEVSVQSFGSEFKIFICTVSVPFRVRVAIRTLKENGGNSRTMREFANP
ncbi:MAG: hypothetical protein SOZ78_00865 [Eubacteriales bacterium]|nr:hypothetical protein [Eubacteriales bacterium]